MFINPCIDIKPHIPEAIRVVNSVEKTINGILDMAGEQTRTITEGNLLSDIGNL